MLQCLNKKDTITENNTLDTILVQYVLFYCTIPTAFIEDREGPDVAYRDGLDTGNKH